MTLGRHHLRYVDPRRFGMPDVLHNGEAATHKLLRALTLRAAIAAGGTTIRDYVGADEGEGWFQRELLVYGRGGEPCRRCEGTVRRTVAGGRATYACTGCQR